MVIKIGKIRIFKNKYKKWQLNIGVHKVESFRDFKYTMRHEMRISRHNRFKRCYSWIIKKLAWALIKRHNYYKSDYAEPIDVPITTHNKFGKDMYPPCTARCKQWCPANKVIGTWVMRFGDYTFYGVTEEEMYMHFIAQTLFRPKQFPFCKR